ncbi:hypothetical protein ONZ45_g12925 [Pleurotus djamor]|nr:hypothetical protein ONZ45_g13854 [Pleurotus djamor]KAJ8495288.1 hypothetical protein ONZ45_g12925 [Pleurotus djamor]
MTNVFYIPEDVVITQGAEAMKHYEDSDTESGRPITRSFCQECGSSLFLKIKPLDFVIVCSGNMQGNTELVPKQQIYCDDKRPWAIVNSEPSLAPGEVEIVMA